AFGGGVHQRAPVRGVTVGRRETSVRFRKGCSRDVDDRAVRRAGRTPEWGAAGCASLVPVGRGPEARQPLVGLAVCSGLWAGAGTRSVVEGAAKTSSRVVASMARSNQRSRSGTSAQVVTRCRVSS